MVLCCAVLSFNLYRFKFLHSKVIVKQIKFSVVGIYLVRGPGLGEETNNYIGFPNHKSDPRCRNKN